MAIDLETIERELENLNQQTNKLIDLVRRLREGTLFDEPLSVSMRASLFNQAKTRWLAIKAAVETLTQEINK